MDVQGVPGYTLDRLPVRLDKAEADDSCPFAPSAVAYGFEEQAACSDGDGLEGWASAGKDDTARCVALQ